MYPTGILTSSESINEIEKKLLIKDEERINNNTKSLINEGKGIETSFRGNYLCDFNFSSPTFLNKENNFSSEHKLNYDYDDYYKYKEDMGNNHCHLKDTLNSQELNRQCNDYAGYLKKNEDLITINSKLTDLENQSDSSLKNNLPIRKNDYISHSRLVENKNSPLRSECSNLSTANFRNNRIDLLEKNINQLKEQLTNSLRKKDERLFKLEKDREMLSRKNQDLENEINRLDSMVNINIYNNPSEKLNGEAKKERKSEVNTSNTPEKKGKTHNKMKWTKSQSVDKKRSVSMSKKLTKTTSKSKAKQTISIKEDPLIEENKSLKNKVTELEQQIKNMKDNIALDNLEKKGKDHLRVELEIWKNRSESIAKTYVESITAIKKQLIQDKLNYTDQIKLMKTTFTNEINSLKGKYQTTIEKLEINNKILKRDNEELKKKVNKVKEIFNSTQRDRSNMSKTNKER